MAFESAYGAPAGHVAPEILSYNVTVPDDRKLLVTALDIEHSINNSKPDTVKYFEHLGARSSSIECTIALEQAIAKLLFLKTQKELHRYLDELEAIY